MFFNEGPLFSDKLVVQRMGLEAIMQGQPLARAPAIITKSCGRVAEDVDLIHIRTILVRSLIPETFRDASPIMC